ncbi:MAG TPA: Smr/MutS family protein [Gemmatimonadota bacterium]|jgi:DNA mismatch repair protein MutS2
MDAHTLAVLEFERMLALVAEYAAFESGRRAVRARAPLPSVAAAALELERVEEAARLLDPGEGFPFEPVYDVEAALRELAVEGSVLQPQGLIELARTLRSARRVKKFFARRDDLPQLQGESRTLIEERLLEERVLGSFDEDGELADAASPELRRLRADYRARRKEIKDHLERILRSLPRGVLTPDPAVTLREGRYVIPVLREAKTVLKGIIHDESASGITIYVEPDAVIPLNNSLRETELAVRREELRVLRQLTHLLRPVEIGLGMAFAFLTELDSLFARARFRTAFGGGRFTFNHEDRIVVRRGRHPLLVASLRETGGEVVPLDLELEPDERTLLVTGPNTGGKTVLLKTVGAAALLAQAGIPPLVDDGTTLPFFESIFADIGDEQSIESSLSTFSSHLRNIVRALEQADETSLVLLDEIGVGTDPHEGVALAAAVLETLTRRRSRTLSTTHYGELKKLAASLPGMINGALDFDSDRIQPRYRFRKGIPGRSYGLLIARALGLSEATIAEATRFLDRDFLAVQDLTDDLARQAEALDARAAQLEQEAAAERRRLAEAERVLQEKGAHQEKEFQDQVERLIRRHRDVLRGVRERLKRIHEQERQREVLEDARRELEESRQTLEVVRTSAAPPPPEFAVGDEVELARLGITGDVVEVLPGRGEVVVRSRGKRFQVPAAELVALPRSAPTAARGTVTYAEPEAASDELDLRGLTAEEIDLPLSRAVDRAVAANLARLRVIHGKGGGVLRDRVQARLAADPRVRSFRLGLWHEGGSGVTVAELA